MESSKSKTIIEQYFVELNSGLPKTPAMVDKYISDRDVELKQHIQIFELAFPGYQLQPREFIAEGNKVSVSFTFIGTHTGEFMGIPASNKEAQIPGFISYHLEDDKIVAHEMVVDTMALMQQIGGINKMAA